MGSNPGVGFNFTVNCDLKRSDIETSYVEYQLKISDKFNPGIRNKFCDTYLKTV